MAAILRYIIELGSFWDNYVKVVKSCDKIVSQRTYFFNDLL